MWASYDSSHRYGCFKVKLAFRRSQLNTAGLLFWHRISAEYQVILKRKMLYQILKRALKERGKDFPLQCLHP